MKRSNKSVRILFLLFFTSPAAFAENTLSYQVDILYQVINVEATQQGLKKYLEETGFGFFYYRDNQKMNLKIQPDKIAVFLEQLKKHGLIVKQDLKTENYREKIMELEVTVKTQEEGLRQTLVLIDRAGFVDAVSIEESLEEMIEEIENARGQLRYIRERIKYAYIALDFKTYAAAVKSAGAAPFAWVNRLRLDNLFGSY